MTVQNSSSDSHGLRQKLSSLSKGDLIEELIGALMKVTELSARPGSVAQASGWQPIDTYPNDNSVVLVANPDEGTLPVIAWKVEDLWYHQDIMKKIPLDPQPTLWMAWPKMPRAGAVSSTGRGSPTTSCRYPDCDLINCQCGGYSHSSTDKSGAA